MRRDTLPLEHDLQHFSLLCLFMASATQVWRHMCSSLVAPLCLRTGTAGGSAEYRVPYEDTTEKARCKLEASGQSLLSDSLYGAVWCSTVVYVILWHVLQFMVTL